MWYKLACSVPRKMKEGGDTWSVKLAYVKKATKKKVKNKNSKLNNE